MGKIADQFANAFRDHAMAGIPASGLHEVVKAEVRTIGGLIETALGNVGMGALVDVSYATRSALDADLAHNADAVGLVYADAADDNNDIYIKVGASGSGSWTRTEVLHSFVSALAARLDALEDAGLFRPGTLTEREDYTYRNGGTPDVRQGMHWYATDQGRFYVWLLSGDKDPKTDVALTSDGWVSIYTVREFKNLGIDFFGTLPAANVESLPAALTDIAAISAVEIADFRVQAWSSAANPTVTGTWDIKGAMPTSQTYGWNGYTVALDGAARSFTPPAWDAITLARIVGNSLSDARDDNGTTVTHWPTIYGAATGQTIVNDAAYSSDWVQMLRAGLAPIMLTINDGILPAAGTSANVTAINGAAPSISPSDGVSFLSVGDATVLTGLTMTGWIGDRHVTVSVPNGGSAAYSVIQDAGGAAVPLDGPVLFIPDHALSNGKGVVHNATGQNYFYASIPQTYQGHTGYFNAGAFQNDVLIHASARGWPVLDWPVLPQADWAIAGTGNPYDAAIAFNALRETFFPSSKMRDAAGRTLLQRLQAAAIPGDANDAADIARGSIGGIPRSLRQKNGDGSFDPLHPSVTVNPGQTVSGQQVIAAFVVEALAALSRPPAITKSTAFTLSVSAVQDGTGEISRSNATAVVEKGALASSLTTGLMTSGQWSPVTGLPRLRLVGTGSVVFDADNGLGVITAGISPLSAAGATNLIKYPYFGDDTTRVRPTITGSLTVTLL